MYESQLFMAHDPAPFGPVQQVAAAAGIGRPTAASPASAASEARETRIRDSLRIAIQWVFSSTRVVKVVTVIAKLPMNVLQ